MSEVCSKCTFSKVLTPEGHDSCYFEEAEGYIPKGNSPDSPYSCIWFTCKKGIEAAAKEALRLKEGKFATFETVHKPSSLVQRVVNWKGEVFYVNCDGELVKGPDMVGKKVKEYMSKHCKENV